MGSGMCDKNGCDIQPHRLGTHDFFGPGSDFQIDSTQPVTVTTQFITNDGTDQGKLVEVRQFYKQNGKTIEHPAYTVNGQSHDSITDDFAVTGSRPLRMARTFCRREDWMPWRRPSTQAWSLSCPCGMTTTQTCSGWTAPTPPTALSQAHTVALAAPTLACLQTWRKIKLMPQ